MENNDTIKELLKEYEEKHTKALIEFENRKKALYNRCPELLNIENELHKLGIASAKNILTNTNSFSLDKLKKEIEALNIKRQHLLKELNVDETYLHPSFECKICKDTGYVTNNYQTTMCTCLKQKLLDVEYNKCNISNLNKENFDNFEISLYSDIIDKEKYNSNISPRENIQIIKKLSEEFINNFDNVDSKNLLFTGNTGLGKTFISGCIANELLKKRKNRTISNRSCYVRFYYRLSLW